MTREAFSRNVVCALPWMVVLFILAYAPIRSGKLEEHHGLARAIDLMQNRGLSELDADAQTEGYYEGLLDQSAQNASVGSGLMGRLGIAGSAPPPAWPRLFETDAVEWGDPYLRYRLKRNLNTTFKELPLRTNRWGQRDRDYDRQKPAGTFRIAVVGSSVTMGSGVAMEQSFENLLERQLNEAHLGEGIERYEVINFSVAGYRLTQQLEVVLEQALAFDVDVVMLVLDDLAVNPYWSRHVISLLRSGADLKYDFLKELAARERLRAAQRPSTIAARLAPHRDAVIEACLERMHEVARRSGAELVVLQVAQPKTVTLLGKRLRYANQVLAQRDIPVVDLLDTFEGVENPEALCVRPWDGHPNAEGHRLLYENLYRKIQTDPRLSRMILRAAASGVER